LYDLRVTLSIQVKKFLQVLNIGKIFRKYSLLTINISQVNKGYAKLCIATQYLFILSVPYTPVTATIIDKVLTKRYNLFYKITSYEIDIHLPNNIG